MLCLNANKQSYMTSTSQLKLQVTGSWRLVSTLCKKTAQFVKTLEG